MMLIPIRNVVAGLCAAVTLSGCAGRTVMSEPVDKPRPTSDAEAGGLVYSLPKTLVTVTGKQDNASKSITYTITPSIVPDASQRYRLRYVASSFSEDDLNFQVDKNGLLTSTKADSTDRIGDIAVVLAKTAATLAVEAAPTRGRRRPAPAESPYPFTTVLDLSEISANGTLTLPDQAILSVSGWHPVAATAGPQTCDYSVCYRTTTVLKGAITLGSRQTGFAFVAVDPSRIEGVDLNTALLVTRKNTVTFDSGLATSIAINKPSSGLAVASLPLNIIKAIFSAPAELLNLKVTNVQDQASLLTQQTAVVNATAALQKAKAAPSSTPSASAVIGTGSSP